MPTSAIDSASTFKRNSRPRQINALTVPMMHTLSEVLDDFAQAFGWHLTSPVRLAIVTHAG